MARQYVTAQQAFHLLRQMCKALKIRIVFGFPKYLGNVMGGALYYNIDKKVTRIYLPKSYQTKCSAKYNAVLLHEIGHYMVIKAKTSMALKQSELSYLFSIYEECMAWVAAIHLAKILNININKAFKRVIQIGLDSYIDAAYSELDKHIVKFLLEVQNSLAENIHSG